LGVEVAVLALVGAPEFGSVAGALVNGASGCGVADAGADGASDRGAELVTTVAGGGLGLGVAVLAADAGLDFGVAVFAANESLSLAATLPPPAAAGLDDVAVVPPAGRIGLGITRVLSSSSAATNALSFNDGNGVALATA
jgi:hypothetical protein